MKMDTSSAISTVTNAVNHRSSLNVAVLMGGISPEREVSLKSGKRIAAALRKKGCSVAEIDPSREYGSEEMLFFRTAPTQKNCRRKREKRKNCRRCPRRDHCIGGNLTSSVCHHRRSSVGTAHKNGQTAEFTASSIAFCQKADLVFLALHGGAGEDGKIAAVLECLGIPHTGSDHKGLCISMDKLTSKRLFLQSGIETPCFTAVSVDEFPQFPRSDDGFKPSNHGELPHLPPFPCVIKPLEGGSSIGVEIAETEEELHSALNRRKGQAESLIIEKKISGREFTVGILQDKALAVTEIIPKVGFYDYENKYTAGKTDEITPAEIDVSTAALLKETALKAHKALGLQNYSRVDIILEAETNVPYVLEVNALPGMTETSLLPQGALAEGIDFETLCEQMLNI